MKSIKVIFGIFLAGLTITACVKDLDVKPKDPNSILSGNIGDDPDYMKQVLGKIYASFIIAGQGANGGADISAPDENFFTTCRALWNLQEITTDEAICAWGDVGIADLNTQTWSDQNPFLTALYQRLSLSITYANDFIKLTKGSTDADIQRYNAEARFLRALAYYYHMDLFGNPPFTTENDGVGKYYPKQLDQNFFEGRKKLFNYVVSELKAISPKLAAPGGVSTQANRAAAWMLLARVYLNSEVYTGVAKWDSCKMYTDSVITSDAYSLATNYRQNFSADNNHPVNPEMIFAWEQDGINTQGYVGTTFIIESSSDATYLKAENYHGLTSNTNWNGNRARLEFVERMLGINNPGWAEGTDLRALYPADTRVFFKVKKSTDIPAASSSGDYGIGVYKFTALNSDGSQPENYNPAFACTDFPVFRLADAYLMRAEANYHLGNTAAALIDINYVRDRAFQGGDFGSTVTSTYRLTTITLDDILAERGREFYYEAQRRTDLIRFGKFTSGDFLWAWKGGVKEGTSTPEKLNLFPIPAAEVSANPYIGQNPNY
ncbi:MAG: starch-binding outer membrane protein SusD/RagB family [Tenuifilum sp.]|uniref:RagB/SusD family nutrient uptake outer membrane protein n=1 Tax=Tenuifilum sp. TaxID=2760880 RepID=UPI0024AA07FA|nr:RagB/SusD family nutrient uptake outer membrane protein [Tenuifilum sp.]MDI3527546.1 starch-binding outer membrane protein SusD/RagB family [Tenuifilum sp.]